MNNHCTLITTCFVIYSWVYTIKLIKNGFCCCCEKANIESLYSSGDTKYATNFNYGIKLLLIIYHFILTRSSAVYKNSKIYF